MRVLGLIAFLILIVVQPVIAAESQSFGETRNFHVKITYYTTYFNAHGAYDKSYVLIDKIFENVAPESWVDISHKIEVPYNKYVHPAPYGLYKHELGFFWSHKNFSTNVKPNDPRIFLFPVDNFLRYPAQITDWYIGFFSSGWMITGSPVDLMPGQSTTMMSSRDQWGGSSSGLDWMYYAIFEVTLLK